MQIFLPIADVSVNVFLLLGLGAAVGFLSGLFGVGGGFLLTPLLFFIGIPSAVAVATGAALIVASSFSGLLAHLKRKTVDFRMGTVLLIGGLIGSSIGVLIYSILRQLGQIDLLVKLFYVVLLGSLGTMMLIESLNALRRSKLPNARIERKRHNWVHALPLKAKFRASGLYISLIPPVAIGISVGILAAIMGVGGGFILVPAMIYLLGMPTKVVIGTSLFQATFLTGYTTLLQATTNQTVDLGLAVVLVLGGVIGTQFGTQFGARLKAEQIRILLALLVLAVGINVAMGLVLRPTDLYSVHVAGAG